MGRVMRSSKKTEFLVTIRFEMIILPAFLLHFKPSFMRYFCIGFGYKKKSGFGNPKLKVKQAGF